MARLWEIAPPATWALLALASVCLLGGLVLLSHSLVRSKAKGDGWGGWLARGRLETTVRLGLALLLGGGLLWGVTLDASGPVLWLLGGGAALLGGLEGASVARRT